MINEVMGYRRKLAWCGYTEGMKDVPKENRKNEKIGNVDGRP
jgi:hypothetical protein